MLLQKTFGDLEGVSVLCLQPKQCSNINYNDNQSKITIHHENPRFPQKLGGFLPIFRD